MRRDRPDIPITDEALVRAAAAGDTSAFETLYLRHRDWVVNVACRFTRDRDLALDVLQETFSYVLRKLPALELRCPFRAFLYPVIRNSALTAESRRRRRIPQRPRSAVERHCDPTRAEGLARLADAVANLPIGQREVLILRFADELSLSDIATALDVPVGTVKSRLHHALGALRQDERTKDYFSEKS